MTYLSNLELRYTSNRYANASTFFIFAELQDLLKKLNNDEIKKSGIAKFLANRYLSKQKEKYAKYVRQAFNIVESGKEPYDRFFLPDGINSLYNPKYKEILDYFGVKNVLGKNINELLFNHLQETIDNKGELKVQYLGNKKASEIMGLMALYWLKMACRKIDPGYLIGKHQNDFDSWINHNKKLSDDFSFLACEAIIKAQKFKVLERQILVSETGKELIKGAEIRALRKRAKQGSSARHKNTNEIKNKVIEEYQQEKIKYEESGKILSKNYFAKKMAEKYNLAFTTIRNNWLKGFDLQAKP